MLVKGAVKTSLTQMDTKELIEIVNTFCFCWNFKFIIYKFCQLFFIDFLSVLRMGNLVTIIYYSTITSLYHIRTRGCAKYESVLHCSERITL